MTCSCSRSVWLYSGSLNSACNYGDGVNEKEWARSPFPVVFNEPPRPVASPSAGRHRHGYRGTGKTTWEEQKAAQLSGESLLNNWVFPDKLQHFKHVCKALKWIQVTLLRRRKNPFLASDYWQLELGHLRCRLLSCRKKMLWRSPLFFKRNTVCTPTIAGKWNKHMAVVMGRGVSYIISGGGALCIPGSACKQCCPTALFWEKRRNIPSKGLFFFAMLGLICKHNCSSWCVCSHVSQLTGRALMTGMSFAWSLAGHLPLCFGWMAGSGFCSLPLCDCEVCS